MNIFEYNLNRYLNNKSYRFFGGGGKSPSVVYQTATPTPMVEPSPTSTPIQRAPTPSKQQTEYEQKNADARRQRILANGRQGTLLTETVNTASGKASKLGRTA